MVISYQSFLAYNTTWGTIEFNMACTPSKRMEPPLILDLSTPLPHGRRLRVWYLHLSSETNLWSDLLIMPHFPASQTRDFFYQQPDACASLVSATLTWDISNIVPLVLRDKDVDVSLPNAQIWYQYTDLHFPKLTGDQIDFFVNAPRVIDSRHVDELWSISFNLNTFAAQCEKLRTIIGGSAIPRD